MIRSIIGHEGVFDGIGHLIRKVSVQRDELRMEIGYQEVTMERWTDSDTLSSVHFHSHFSFQTLSFYVDIGDNIQPTKSMQSSFGVHTNTCYHQRSIAIHENRYYQYMCIRYQ
jgi:hypothetical protein